MSQTDSKYAYVSLLFGNDSYVPGAIILGTMLRRVLDVPHDCILMITNDISEEAVLHLKKFWIIHRVSYLEFPNAVSKRIPAHRAYYAKTFTKLHMLTLTTYEKVLFMDLSYIPLSRKIDDLFSYQTPAMAYVMQYLTGPDGKRKKGLVTRKKIPKEMSRHVNASLILMKPSMDEYSNLIDTLHRWTSPKLRYPEQEFLGLYYAGHIHLINPQFYCNKYYPKCTKSCLGIKFLPSIKPWDKSPDELDECDKIWLKLYKLGLDE